MNADQNSEPTLALDTAMSKAKYRVINWSRYNKALSSSQLYRQADQKILTNRKESYIGHDLRANQMKIEVRQTIEAFRFSVCVPYNSVRRWLLVTLKERSRRRPPYWNLRG